MAIPFLRGHSRGVIKSAYASKRFKGGSMTFLYPFITEMHSHSNRSTTNEYVAVIGCGTSGRRIGLVWASKFRVKLFDHDTKCAQNARTWIQSQLPAVNAHIGDISDTVETVSTLADAVQNAWMVVESIPEVVILKARLMGQIDSLAAPTTIIATNSSAIKSSSLLTNVHPRGRRRILNIHYFLPPQISTVEVMGNTETDPQLIAGLLPRLRTVGLDPIVAKVESTGLIGNRIWAAIKREVMLVLAEHVAGAEDIDKVFKEGFHAKSGPCEIMDTVGLDTVCDIESHYMQERQNLPAYGVDFIRQNYVDCGNLGVSTGRGLLPHSSENAPPGSLREEILGVWELVEYAHIPRSDAAPRHLPFGNDICGRIMYTADGYMSVHLELPGQAPMETEDPMHGSAAELAESARRYLAYSGTFSVEETPPQVHHHIAFCSFPNWRHTVQRRIAKVEIDMGQTFLTLAPDDAPRTLAGDGTLNLRWRKLSQQSS